MAVLEAGFDDATAVLMLPARYRERQRTVITPKVDEFFRECLNEDEKEEVVKQNHTAKRIFDRLVLELGFSGGESTIRHYVKELKVKPAEAFGLMICYPG